MKAYTFFLQTKTTISIGKLIINPTTNNGSVISCKKVILWLSSLNFASGSQKFNKILVRNIY